LVKRRVLPLHVHGQGEPREQLLAALRGRELLVLDNFEHLITDGADLLIDVLQAAPEVRLLVTSHECLRTCMAKPSLR
jgi:predicted ATPase